MDVRGIVENELKWVMITSGHKNESWGDENNNKNYACKKTKILESINNRVFFCLYSSILSSDNQWLI